MPTENELETPEIDETPEVEAEAETEETGEEQESEPSESSTEKKNGVQQRFNEMTAARREAEQERDYWRQMALANAQPQPQQPAPETAPPDKTLADFDYDETAYTKYVMETMADRASQAAVSKAQEVINQNQQQKLAQERQVTFQSKENKYAESYPDYYTATRDPSVPINQTMADIAMESPDGPAVLYYLSKNPDMAYNIANMQPRAAAREMGRIEAKLSSKQKASTSKAPPPPGKIEGVDPAITKDPDKMSTDEWLKWRNKQL